MCVEATKTATASRSFDVCFEFFAGSLFDGTEKRENQFFGQARTEPTPAAVAADDDDDDNILMLGNRLILHIFHTSTHSVRLGKMMYVFMVDTSIK